MMDKKLKEFKEHMKKRDELFRNPSLEAAKKFFEEMNGITDWAREDVPLAALHKGRLQWLEATDAMIAESITWLTTNGYDTTMNGGPPLTPEIRDADRVSLGKKPLGES
jgi:hypothetical protein